MKKNMSDSINRIIVWGKENVDNFPWRSPNNAYESAIAEIMLIRTSPEQVLNVFEKFLLEFPNVISLAKSSQKDINKYISKLGLNWRSEIILNFAQYIVKNYNNKLPEDKQKLLKIPGIGLYISAAIYTFYLKKRALMIDSNTVRFFRRYLNNNYTGEARRNKKLKNQWDSIVPKCDSKAVEFNIAFLDFMRKICTPRNPNCSNCILSKNCSYNN